MLNPISTPMYSKKQFDKCVFNPLTENKMLSVYPKLSEIIEPDWAQDENLDKLIRFTILVYDLNSPLVSDEKDLTYRKGLAAELAGMDDTMYDKEFMEEVYTSKHAYLPHLIFKYLIRFCKSRDWAAICALEFKFWEAVRQSMQPITGKNSKEELEAIQKKAVIADEIDKDLKRIDTYYKTFFGNDSELEVKAKKRITPEQIAGL